MAIDYSALAERTARNSAIRATGQGGSLCPLTGLPMVDQKAAAMRLGITARAMRDLDPLPAHSGGRGKPTLYYLDALDTLAAIRRGRFSDAPDQPLRRIVEGNHGDFEPDELWQAMHPNVALLRAQLDFLSIPEPDGKPPAYLDQDGAAKAQLLLSELARVLRDHCGTSGVNGAHFERDAADLADLDNPPEPMAQTYIETQIQNARDKKEKTANG